MTDTASRLEHLVIASGPRLRIRRKHRDDAVDDYTWRRDAELARYDGREPLDESFADFLARFEYDLRYESPRERAFAIDTNEGEHIGTVMYYGLSSTLDSAEFGITIGLKDYQSRGYGREATIVFLRHLWETTPIRVIVLHALDWNERAIRCFEGAGFEATGHVERQGHRLVQMEARREWWLLHESEGRFALPRR